MPQAGAHRDPGRLEALQILGLAPGASQRQVKRAYRRLALRYHPDRNDWSADAGAAESDHHVRFRQVAGAYAVLERCFMTAGAEQKYGQCDRCNDFEPLQTGLDGNMYCRACLLTAHGKRALPAPPMVVAGCGLTVVGLAMSAATLAVWTATGQWVYWWTSVTACATAMIALAVLCLTVQYAVPRQRRRTGLARGSRRNAWRRPCPPPSLTRGAGCPTRP